MKKIDAKKQPGLAALKKKRPDVVKKMGYFKKGGRVGMMDGGPIDVKADNAVDMVGNPKGKKQRIQIKGFGKARH